MACFAKLFHKNNGFNPTPSANLPNIPDKSTKTETGRYIAKPEGSIKFLNPDDLPEQNHQKITLTTPSQNLIINSDTNTNTILNNKQNTINTNTITSTSGTNINNNNNSNNIIQKKQQQQQNQITTTTHLNSNNNNNNNNLHEKPQEIPKEKSQEKKIKKTNTKTTNNKLISTTIITNDPKSSTNTTNKINTTTITNTTTNDPCHNNKIIKSLNEIDKNEILSKTFINSKEQQQQSSNSTNTNTKKDIVINKSTNTIIETTNKEKLLQNHTNTTTDLNCNINSSSIAGNGGGEVLAAVVNVNPNIKESKKDKQKTLRRPGTTIPPTTIISLNPGKSIEKLQKKILIKSTEMMASAGTGNDSTATTKTTKNNNIILENCQIENSISVINLPIIGAHIIGNKDYEERRHINNNCIQAQYGTKITVPLYLEELKKKQMEQQEQQKQHNLELINREKDEIVNSLHNRSYKNGFNNIDYFEEMISKNDRCNPNGGMTLIADFSGISKESLANPRNVIADIEIENKNFNNLENHCDSIDDCGGDNSRLTFGSNDDENSKINNSIDTDENLLENIQVTDTRNEIDINEEIRTEVREFTSETDRKFSEVENKNPSLKSKRYLSTVSVLQDGDNAETGRKEGIFIIRPPVVMVENVPVHKKDDKTSKLIMKAIENNDFLNNYMDDERKKRVIDAMEPAFYDKGKFIIRENEEGSEIYVSDDGVFDVIKNNEIINTLGSGIVFGELAILYNAKRFASIRAATKAKVWKIDRTKFRTIMKISGSKERDENLAFLKTAPFIKDLRDDILLKVVDLLARRFFPTNTCIIQQDDTGDEFYIIRGGTVTVKKTDQHGEEHKVNRLKRGEYFGEQALLNSDVRQASVYADAPGTECLKLDRVNFISYLGTIPELKEKPIDRDIVPEINPAILNTPYDYIELKDLKRITSLGAGAFGRVDLVTYQDNKSFALKVIKKIDVVKQGQSDHIYNEKLVMSMCHRSPFIVELYKTFRDSKYVYFMMEACMGGDVWTIMYQMKFFDERTARFISGCVVEAFDFLHSRNIIFRDLKPENLMLTTEGYCKLVDFGFAKRLSTNYKTNTFAGTPEYVAPEIIQDRGHDRAADYWTFGVLIYELLVGRTPFRGKNEMKIYQNILAGINVIKMPSKISKSAQNLIKHLCRQLPVERLGYQRKGIMDIKKHSWFENFDWNRLQNQTMSSPIKRPVNSIIDTQYFPTKFEIDSDIPPDEFSGWDINF